MTLNSFNALTVTVTPQSILWKYTSEQIPLSNSLDLTCLLRLSEDDTQRQRFKSTVPTKIGYFIQPNNQINIFYHMSPTKPQISLRIRAV